MEQGKLVADQVGKPSRDHSEVFLKKIYLNEKTFRDRGSRIMWMDSSALKS